MTKVLLFGSTGAVGASCLDILARRGEVSLLIAGRDEARLRDIASAIQADVEILRLDVADTSAVAAAVTRCDVVINCAGPSQRLSADVAGAAIATRVPYVDPGGDRALLDRIAAAAPAVPVVLQAGVQPGLSGLLLRVLSLHRRDKIDGVTAWSGGLQRLTPASVLEYVASLHDTNSHPGAALRDGVIRRVSHDECKPAPTQYFPDSATVRPHLDAETVSVAAHLGIRNVRWMNVFDGVHTTRAMQLLAVDDKRPRTQTDLGDVLAVARLDLFGREPYFAIVGSAHGNGGSTTVAFTCPDSYRITGALTAFAAQHVAGMPAGAQPFWRVDEPRQVLEFLTEAVPEAKVSFVDDSAAGAVNPQFLMIEEGSL
ncbi:saccharopine dehydrogenase NADP-binding domain-containing protein [Mycobacterium sp.]|uniref:saccharopine dehydrogenase NADP-binding domain-containing protein n=1 Tax=Mycobacterium sp. TaxID=1785 RepID=UPI003F970750